jgi:hypothetical protein
MAKKLLTAKAMRRIKEGGVEFMAGCGGEGRNIGSPAQRRMRRSLRQRMAMVSKPIETAGRGCVGRQVSECYFNHSC